VKAKRVVRISSSGSATTGFGMWKNHVQGCKMHCFIRVCSEEGSFWTFVGPWKLMPHGPFNLLMFSCHKFPIMHFLKEEELLRNVKKAGRICGCSTQLPDSPCYSAPCVPISTPPACTARNCDIYGGREHLAEKFLNVS